MIRGHLLGRLMTFLYTIRIADFCKVLLLLVFMFVEILDFVPSEEDDHSFVI